MKKQIVAVYPYLDQDGIVLHETVRYSDKSFSQRCPDGEGGHVSSLDGVARLPYRLPAMLAVAPGDNWIDYTEGEKDADCLIGLGLVATTNAEGVRAELTPSFLEHFRGRKVVVWCDNDEAGLVGGRKHALALASVAAEVRLVIFPADKSAGYDVTDYINEGHDRADIEAIRAAAPRLGDDATLLDDIAGFIKRFVALGDNELVVCTLWVVHTYTIDACTYTPYMHVSSPTAECGKTRLFDVFEVLVSNPLATSRPSVAAMIRILDNTQGYATLLADEIDIIFNGPVEVQVNFTGVLNAGYQRGKKAHLCDRVTHKPQAFELFGPKAFAGIGKGLPDTVKRRSVPIDMQRKRKAEVVEKFRERGYKNDAEDLRRRLTAWGATHLDRLRNPPPYSHAALSDRSEDVLEPLITIADQFTGMWPNRAREAAVNLCSRDRAVSSSLKERLLADARTAFGGEEALHTVDLLDRLCHMSEAPWASYRCGDKPMTPRGLAEILRDFGISSKQLRIGGTNRNGYEKANFADAWERFCP
jgi:hypothetical protein